MLRSTLKKFDGSREVENNDANLLASVIDESAVCEYWYYWASQWKQNKTVVERLSREINMRFLLAEVS